MLTRVLALLISALFASLAACSRNAGTCAINTDCPDGHVCLSEKCEQVCTVDTDCASGHYCSGEICITGRRESPVISGVTGNGSGTDCMADTGTNCLGTAFVVTGSNLGGSTFKLVSSLPNGPQYNLTIADGGRIQDAVVDLVPSLGGSVVQAGTYLLTATNAAGSAQTSVQLLKGDKGEKGDPGTVGNLEGDDIINAINDSGTLTIDAARVAGGGGGGTRHLYDNSTTPVDSAISGDRIVIRLNGHTDGTTNVFDLKNTLFPTLCGDADGCTLKLGVTHWHPYGDAVSDPTNSYAIPAAQFAASCHMSIDASGNWAVASSCTQFYATWPGVDTWDSPPDKYFPYRSGGWGTDGGDDYDSPPTTRSWTILHNFACYLSESAPTGSAAGFADDSAAGMFFFASGPSWAGLDTGSGFYPSKFWPASDGARACILIVED